MFCVGPRRQKHIAKVARAFLYVSAQRQPMRAVCRPAIDPLRQLYAGTL
jgi:hypothetical protein